jgi:hypothetical protein
MKATKLTFANASNEVQITMSETQAKQLFAEIETLTELAWRAGGAVGDLDKDVLVSLKKQLYMTVGRATKL